MNSSNCGSITSELSFVGPAGKKLRDMIGLVLTEYFELWKDSKLSSEEFAKHVYSEQNYYATTIIKMIRELVHQGFDAAASEPIFQALLDQEPRTTKITLFEMESIPAGESPYYHDGYNMGQEIGKDLMLMKENRDDEECRFFILEDKRSGKRFRFDIDRNIAEFPQRKTS